MNYTPLIMSYVQNFVHIVFTTKFREMVIPLEYENQLYNYIIGFFKENKSYVLSINGIPNHIHILANLSPLAAPSTIIGNLKRSTSIWLKSNRYFPMFKGWQREYACFSVSFSHIEAVKQYIDSQKEHHVKMRFEDEYSRLIMKNGLVMYDPEAASEPD